MRKFAQATLTLGRATIALRHDNAVNAVADCVFFIDADQIIEDNDPRSSSKIRRTSALSFS
jgi:hypothetical protein